jgi:hypothetical protein
MSAEERGITEHERMTPYKVVLGGTHVVGSLGLDGKINYDTKAITEMIAGQSGKTTGHFSTTAQVVYRYNSSRKTSHNNMWTLWKNNPIMNNRITQLNSLIFGTGLKWIYDESTQKLIDRFWRVNRLRSKLNSIGTDGQIYGEIFLGLYPQSSGDVLMSVYESRQVDIDFDPGDVNKINRYIITYKNEETGKEEQFDMMPIETYLNNIEFSQGVNTGIIGKVRKALGLTGASKVTGKGVMCHIKFNNSSGEVYGTSDFYQVSDLLQDYMDFVGDRLTVHQLYGSPAYDIEIDSDDPQVIQDRIEELASFTLGSNPVHNKQEKWTPLEFKSGALAPSEDDKLLRGLLSAGTNFPEFMLFNQIEAGGDDNTFSVTKLAQDRQGAFRDALVDVHKFVVAIGGGDIMAVDDGQIVFPEIDTMSEKSKAETYVLKVGANICSRRTAAMNMGHNYDIELERIQEESKILSPLLEDPDFAGAAGGYTSNRLNNSASQDPGDNGTSDRKNRNDATKVKTTQVMSSNKIKD